MSDQVFMFGAAAGAFVFLAAVLFASRGARKRHGSGGEETTTSESHSSSSSGGSGSSGKRVKKFRSDGTPVYE